MNNTFPLVSCIMPTANREKFVPHAVRYFQRQDYPNKELVIIDDGTNSIENLLPQDSQIRYKKLDTICVTGEKRNIACEYSSGELIMHWDDDDWYAPNWISHQVNCLQSSNSDIAGLSSFYLHAPLQNKSWIYTYPPHNRPWVAGTSMIYRKSFWEKHPFKKLKIGEDSTFIWDSRSKVNAHNYKEGVVALVHRKNTSRKIPNSSRWKPVSAPLIEQILGEDAATYRSLLI